MQQIADWLEKLGMSEYAHRFAENRIDFSILPELTDQHLKDLGIALGDRLKMLRAIRELADAIPASRPPEPKAPDAAERRQVTVMFSDLVGSTAISARMDPEDLREVISAYQKCVAKTVLRFGGYVAKYMGDGVLVYFGYPQAHEDDAERAVRAGLELVTAVSDLRTHAALQTRVGIATGLVVVGDLIGSGAAQEQAVVGETPNLAARLQGIAEPKTVVISESTRKLLGNLFELEDLGAKELKGIAGPLRAWAALRPSSIESRFEALHASGLTELVGREEELEILLRRWSKAKTGEGQIVLLSGEAGIGKSRLTAALLERLATEPHTRLRYFCSPQHTDSALYPIIGQIERAAGLAHGDTAQVRLDKLDALLAQTSTSKQDAALFAEMLSLPNDGRYPVLNLDPQQRRQKTLEALTTQVEALSRQNPVLMIFEDAHWTDPTSLETFSRVVDRVRSRPALLIVTFRPEFVPPWIGRPYVTALTINRLAQRDIEAMIDRVVGNKLISASVRHDIIERTDGIPLFVEEMTKAVLEAESEEEAQRTAATVPSTTLAVPASLHASLMARLDRLGPAKEVAQIGSAIGREFSHALLASVTRKPEAELGSTLDRLIHAGLLFRQGVPPHATYLFKHALVQDAAYGTLLREPRRALHARIAETLEGEFTEIAESQPELLARHCTEAGLIEKGAGLWGKAGRQSLERSALVEAIEQLQRALDLFARLSGTPELRREEVRLQVAIITPIAHVKGFAATETKTAIERARLLIEKAQAIGEPPDDPLLLFAVLFGFFLSNIWTFDGRVCRDLATHFLALAEKHNATAPLLMAHRMMGQTSLFSGDVVRARMHLDKGLGLYDPAEHGPLAMRFGHDAQVVMLSFRSSALWLLGYPDAGLSDGDEALKKAREMEQAATVMFALWSTAANDLNCGAYSVASARAQELFAVSEEKGAHWKLGAQLLQGCAFAHTGKALDAVQMVTPVIAKWRSEGVTVAMPNWLSHLAWANAELGHFDDAWQCIEDALSLIERTGQNWTEAELLRIAGEIALREPTPDAAAAEAHFDRALNIARQQQVKSFELRAATSLARLWRSQGKSQQARELLAPVYGWFTEGFDTRDLKEAKALLEELA
jgi:class 3 adenylate cyclase/predicted ATPase